MRGNAKGMGEEGMKRGQHVPKREEERKERVQTVRGEKVFIDSGRRKKSKPARRKGWDEKEREGGVRKNKRAEEGGRAKPNGFTSY